MNFRKIKDKCLSVAAAVTLLAGSSNAMALGADITDDFKQAVLITLLLLAVFTFLRKRMEY